MPAENNNVTNNNVTEYSASVQPHLGQRLPLRQPNSEAACDGG